MKIIETTVGNIVGIAVACLHLIAAFMLAMDYAYGEHSMVSFSVAAILIAALPVLGAILLRTYYIPKHSTFAQISHRHLSKTYTANNHGMLVFSLSELKEVSKITLHLESGVLTIDASSAKIIPDESFFDNAIDTDCDVQTLCNYAGCRIIKFEKAVTA